MPTNDQLTPQEIADYGQEFLHVVGKQARQATAGELHQLKQGMAEVQHVLHQVKLQEMKKLLDQRLPEWRQQNNDPGFLSWLGERDALSGRSRNDLLQEAWNAGAGERVLALFEAYRAGGSGPGRPGAARQASAGGGASRNVITTSQISQFYDDVRRGRYRGREKEQVDFERAIIDASNAGRVI